MSRGRKNLSGHRAWNPSGRCARDWRSTIVDAAQEWCNDVLCQIWLKFVEVTTNSIVNLLNLTISTPFGLSSLTLNPHVLRFCIPNFIINLSQHCTKFTTLPKPQPAPFSTNLHKFINCSSRRKVVRPIPIKLQKNLKQNATDL